MIATAKSYDEIQFEMQDRHKGRYNFTKDSRVGVRGLPMVKTKADTDSNNHDIEGVATCDAVDASKEVVLPGGADLSYINRFKTLYSDHYYGMSFAVGRFRYLRPYAGKDHKGWEFRAAMFRGLNNGLAEDIVKMAQQGADIASSIGFDALEYSSPTTKELEMYPGAELIIRKWLWIEHSLTLMPCNALCGARLVSAAEVDEKRMAFLDTMLTKSIIARESALAFGFKDAAKKTSLLFSRPKVLTFQRPTVQ